MKIREIIPGKLYTRGRFDHKPKEDKLKALREQGIDIVVCLIRHPDSDLIESVDVEYYYFPMSDGKIRNIGELTVMSAILTLAIKLGKRVLIHCNAGRNRTGLICTLIVRELFGISGSEA